ncbi:hypothetical protein PT974_05473 [Cladobotryum mycophilum]|uniref:Uncharacterized protein n=1 Tax=Cladobotryum mycophilum TaxID=491253 RepID=A0ABR0SK26_9HYPO
MTDAHTATPQTHTAAGCAQLCLHSFQQCVDDASSIHPRELSLIEDQRARFSVWTANIQVFVSNRRSLDHRLREAVEIQNSVIGLLEALDFHIRKCSSILQSFDSTTSDIPPEAVDEKLSQSVREISRDISLLFKFSNTIRRASKESQNSIAATAFRIRDEDGNDVENFLQELFSRYIRDVFPDVSNEIKERLAKTMVLRRKRILYRRSRYGTPTIKIQQAQSQPLIASPSIRPAEIVVGKFTDAQLGALADKNARAMSPMFQSCPLCGAYEVDGGMEIHVVGHLRLLALKSLPTCGDLIEDGFKEPVSESLGQ